MNKVINRILPYNIPKLRLSISLIDAIGFSLISVLMTGPVWAVSIIAESYPAIAYVVAFTILAYNIAEKKKWVVIVLSIELAIDVLLLYLGLYEIGLMVATAFIITFIRVGLKVYGFFFMFVDYKFSLTLTKRQCNSVVYRLDLPSRPSN